MRSKKRVSIRFLFSVTLISVLILACISFFPAAASASNSPEPGSARIIPYPYTDGSVTRLLTGSSFYESSSVAYDPSNGYLYVADSGWNNLTVVNASTYGIEGSVSGFYYPYEVQYDSHSNYLLVVNELYPSNDFSNTSVYDISSERVMHVFNNSYNVVADPVSGDLFVAQGNCISEVSPSTWATISVFTSHADFSSMYFDAPANLLLAQSFNGTLYEINGSSNVLVHTVAVPPMYRYSYGTGAMAVDHSGAIAYIATPRSTLAALSLESGKFLWVTNTSYVAADNLILNPHNQLLYLSGSPGFPGWINAYDSQNGKLFASFWALQQAGGMAYNPRTNDTVAALSSFPVFSHNGLLIISLNYGPAAQSGLFSEFRSVGLIIGTVSTALFLYVIYRKGRGYAD